MPIPSKGIVDLLVNAGYVFGGNDDWALYIGRTPDKPKRVVTVYDSGGRAPNPRWLIDYPSVQVKIRGGAGDYQAAHLEANKIKNALLGLPSQDVDGDRWVHINLLGDIGYIGLDQNEQPEFVLNFSLIIEPAKSAGDNRDPL